MIHNAGFAHVRIPVSFGRHMMEDEPYTIRPAFMERVAELVKGSMSQGLVTVITAQNEWWADMEDRTYVQRMDFKLRSLPRFEAMWRQIGLHFRDSRQLLIFGILNEPNMLRMESLNELHRVALVAIRETNPTRVVTISGKDFANPRWLLEHPKELYIPRDPQLMLEIHVTEPHGFAGARPSRTQWGSEEEVARVREWVDQMEVFGRARNLPIYVGEFGCSNEVPHDQGRLKWLETNWKEMRRQGFCATLLDDGDRFSIYDRKEGRWDKEVLTVLQRALPGLQGVSLYRVGGGLGADSNDPTVDLQRRLELCFSRLSMRLEDVDKLEPLGDHQYQSDLSRGRSDVDDEY
jgi:aryl-phospho-beta-D-glucosidase BglC (GH1 family)